MRKELTLIDSLEFEVNFSTNSFGQFWISVEAQHQIPVCLRGQQIVELRDFLNALIKENEQ